MGGSSRTQPEPAHSAMAPLAVVGRAAKGPVPKPPPSCGPRALVLLLTKILGASLLVGACALDSPSSPPGALNDCGACKAFGDGGGGEEFLGPLLHQSVVHRLAFPTSASDYARDMDGDGKPDNRLGQIVSVVGPFMPFQAELDGAMQKGNVLHLLTVYAVSPKDAPQATVRAIMGLDGDEDPLNNLIDRANLRTDPASAVRVLRGSIRNGRLRVEGQLALTAPLGPGILVVVSTDQAVLEATITPEGLVDGVASGAVAWDRVENELLPPMAKQLSNNLVDPTLRDILDTNRDGEITADELLNNFLSGPFLSPDIDLDGDGIKESMSFGVGFSSIRCHIDLSLK